VKVYNQNIENYYMYITKTLENDYINKTFENYYATKNIRKLLYTCGRGGAVEAANRPRDVECQSHAGPRCNLCTLYRTLGSKTTLKHKSADRGNYRRILITLSIFSFVA
jgi:hypothetical protein